MEGLHNMAYKQSDQEGPIPVENEARMTPEGDQITCISIKDVLGEPVYNYLAKSADEGKFNYEQLKEISRKMNIYGFYTQRISSWKQNDISWRGMLVELLDAWWIEQADHHVTVEALLQILESEDVQLKGLAYSIREVFPDETFEKVIDVTDYKKVKLGELKNEEFKEGSDVIIIGNIINPPVNKIQDSNNKDDFRERSDTQTSVINNFINPTILVHQVLEKTSSGPPSTQTNREDTKVIDHKLREEGLESDIKVSSSWPQIATKKVSFSSETAPVNMDKTAQPQYQTQSSRTSTKSNSTISSDVDSGIFRMLRLLSIIRIIFVNFIFSIGIHVIYFIFAIMLIYHFEDISSLPLPSIKNSITDIEEQEDISKWKSNKRFGIYVLLNMWMPGIIAVSHILAYYKKYKERCDPEKKMKNGSLKLCIVLFYCIFFYPLCPATAYLYLLWRWNTREIRSSSPTATFFATLARTLEGGYEAPSNLIIVFYLYMNGIIDGMNIFLPLVIGSFSVISILLACIKLNAIRPFTPDFSQIVTMNKLTQDASLTYGYFPYFLCSTSVKVLSFSFLWFYLGLWYIVPIFLIWFCNLVIGYSLITKRFRVSREIRKRLKEIHGKSKIPEVAVWLNSFIGLFIPCWYHEQLDEYVVEQLQDNQITEIILLQNKRKKRALQQREVAISIILLIFLGIVLGLANLSDFKSNLGSFDIISFNIFTIVLMVLQLVCLCFAKEPNIFKAFFMFRIVQKEQFRTKLSGKSEETIIMKEIEDKHELKDKYEPEINESERAMEYRSQNINFGLENEEYSISMKRYQVLLSFIASFLIISPYIIGWIINKKYHEEPPDIIND